MKYKYETLIAYTDGGARGNPGPAGIGAVLLDEEGQVVAEVSKYIGHATNNVAEYLAVVYALQEALYQKARYVVINTDSQLIARQIKGKYKVKDQTLLKFRDLILNLFRGFDKVEICEIPREENNKADSLVNKAIDLKVLC
jgi:ribonuclease HI